jgi:hypothetical protein
LFAVPTAANIIDIIFRGFSLVVWYEFVEVSEENNVSIFMLEE